MASGHFTVDRLVCSEVVGTGLGLTVGTGSQTTNVDGSVVNLRASGSIVAQVTTTGFNANLVKNYTGTNLELRAASGGTLSLTIAGTQKAAVGADGFVAGVASATTGNHRLHGLVTEVLYNRASGTDVSNLAGLLVENVGTTEASSVLRIATGQGIVSEVRNIGQTILYRRGQNNVLLLKGSTTTADTNISFSNSNDSQRWYITGSFSDSTLEFATETLVPMSINHDTGLVTVNNGLTVNAASTLGPNQNHTYLSDSIPTQINGHLIFRYPDSTASSAGIFQETLDSGATPPADTYGTLTGLSNSRAVVFYNDYSSTASRPMFAWVTDIVGDDGSGGLVGWVSKAGAWKLGAATSISAPFYVAAGEQLAPVTLIGAADSDSGFTIGANSTGAFRLSNQSNSAGLVMISDSTTGLNAIAHVGYLGGGSTGYVNIISQSGSSFIEGAAGTNSGLIGISFNNTASTVTISNGYTSSHGFRVFVLSLSI